MAAMEQPPGDVALRAVAAELLALPLSSFTTERNARARAARTDGDRDLAARIGALPKPSVAAWLVDLLVREAPEDLQRVLDLGAALRQAQEGGDRERLRELTTVRRSLLDEVTRAAASRAEHAGQRVGDGVLDDVHRTLQASLTSPDAAAAVRTGRLVRALDADGLDPVDLAGAVAGGAPDAAAAERPSRSTPGDAEDVAFRRAAQRERCLREARERVDEATARAHDADSTAQARRQDFMELREQLDALRAGLERGEQELHAAEASAAKARDAVHDAAAEVDRIRSND